MVILSEDRDCFVGELDIVKVDLKVLEGLIDEILLKLEFVIKDV